MIRPDDVGALNPEDLIAGDNGHAQTLTTRRTMVVAKPKALYAGGIGKMVERLCDDAWGNVYLVYFAKLSDGEVWEVADRVRPSVITQHGGMTDDLFDFFRTKAFMALDAQEVHLGRMRANAASALGKLLAADQPMHLGGEN